MAKNDNKYRRPRGSFGKWLDYEKVDWAALQEALDARPGGQKSWELSKWAMRLQCSTDTLYRGLRKYRNGEL